jgi:hypothetical protein
VRIRALFADATKHNPQPVYNPFRVVSSRFVLSGKRLKMPDSIGFLPNGVGPYQGRALSVEQG